jgi:hypothetical protein
MFMNYTEVKGDLFTADSSYTLAHCISVDCAMGAGIAKEFRRRYPDMPGILLQRNPRIGYAMPYSVDGRYIFNLITKEKYWQKPTYDNFNRSIVDLKTKMVFTGQKRLAIPLLGAGLDKLSWATNRQFIQDTFRDTDIEIVVYIL